MNADLDWLEEERGLAERVTRIARMAFRVLAAAVVASTLAILVSDGSYAAQPLAPATFGPGGSGH